MEYEYADKDRKRKFTVSEIKVKIMKQEENLIKELRKIGLDPSKRYTEKELSEARARWEKELNKYYEIMREKYL